MLWGIYSAIYGEVNVSVEKCVEIKGDYVEKYRSCFISVTLKSCSGRKILDPTTYLWQQNIRQCELNWTLLSLGFTICTTPFNNRSARLRPHNSFVCSIPFLQKQKLFPHVIFKINFSKKIKLFSLEGKGTPTRAWRLSIIGTWKWQGCYP